MASSNFNFDKRAFENEFKKMANDAMKDLPKEAEQAFARLSRTHRGKPVSEIKPVLRREWKRTLGGDITDPELTEYAQHISDGTKFDFNVKPLR